MKSRNFIQGALVALVIFLFGFAPVFGQTASGSPSVPSVNAPDLGSDNADKSVDASLAEERDSEDKNLGEERDSEDEGIAEERDSEDKGIAEERDAEDKNLGEERAAEDKGIAKERDAEDKVLGGADGQDKENKGVGVDRRSRVATAVKELLAVADREGGIGEQVREIAKSQQDSHEEAEKALDQVKERKGWVKFLIGPNYKQISLVEDRLVEINNQLDELKNLRGKLTNPEDVVLFDSHLASLKLLQTELQTEMTDSEKGFSLFGWLGKLLSK